jgi:flagellar motility protein MotE (MotC chaperone)
MKTMMQLVIVALIFGGLSAAGTVFLQQRTTTVAAAGADATDSDPTKPPGEDSTIPAGETNDATGGPVPHQAVDSAEHAAPSGTSLADPLEQPHSGGAGNKSTVSSAGNPPSSAEASPSPHPPLATAPHSPRSNGAAAQHQDSTKSQHQGSAKTQHQDSAKSGAAELHPEARVAVRPPYTPEGDEAGRLINQLRERSRVATETERKLAERQDAMQLIFDDLRAEQASALKVRQRLSGELKESQLAAEAALQAVEAERTALRNDLLAAKKERDALRKQLEKPDAPTPSGSGTVSVDTPEDNVNIKKMADVFDSMPAENVAKVFEQLVKNKRTPAVVSLLNAMKERSAAKALGIIAETNAELAADLTDRLKRLKSSKDNPTGE